MLVATVLAIAAGATAVVIGQSSSKGRPSSVRTTTTSASGVNSPPSSGTPGTNTALPVSGRLVFEDKFADPRSGWAPDANQGASGTAAYIPGGYQFTALKPYPVLNTFSVASPYTPKLASLAVTVDVTMATGAPSDGAGVRCDVDGRAGLRYTFEIHGDGPWVIFRLGGQGQTELSQDTSPAIRTGTGTNTVTGQCTEIPDGATRLVMTVNGVVLGTVVDPLARARLPGTLALLSTAVRPVPRPRSASTISAPSTPGVRWRFVKPGAVVVRR